MTQSIVTDGYAKLLRQVQMTLIEGQRRIERERVNVYWETGRLIGKNILEHKDRAVYGKTVLERLSRDLNVHVSLLRRCVQFYKRYPHCPIHARGRELSWSHYRKLMVVPDDKQRKRLEQSLFRNDWSAEELAARMTEKSPQIVMESKPQVTKDQLLTPRRGIPYTYRIISRPNITCVEEPPLMVDAGFGDFRALDKKDEGRFKEGTMVEIRPDKSKHTLFKSHRGLKDLYTYFAFVEKIIDGDTIKVCFDLGFGQWRRETLRLRGIDCPEMDTKAGQAAKNFVQSYGKEAQKIIVCSSRSDKYDRYLADIFILNGQNFDVATDIYLNNLLLERGHATRMD